MGRPIVFLARDEKDAKLELIEDILCLNEQMKREKKSI
jgi:hypothetical protein